MGQFIQMLQDSTLLSAVIRLLLSAVLGGLIAAIGVALYMIIFQ